MLKSISSTGANHLPRSARSAAVATAGLWGLAVLLFTGQAQGDLAMSDVTMQIVVYWLLTVGCTLFWLTFMRVGQELVDADWRIAYELDPGAVLAPGRDRKLDRALAQGLAADRPADFWPANTWRWFAKIGITFWIIAALATVAVAARWLPVNAPYRGILLVMLMIPAVQCTAAGVIGPGLTRMLGLRDAAREARRRVCEHAGAQSPWRPPADDALTGSADTYTPNTDMQDTVTIYMPRELRSPRPARGAQPLRLVEDRPRGRD